jgi:hypothetical protein
LWGLTIPPGVLAIADEAIEYRYFLLQRIRSLLADSVAEVRCKLFWSVIPSL